jgi:hypothetical protein
MTSAGLRSQIAAVTTALVLCATPLAAHDLWIAPTAFAPDPGSVVGVRLLVGQNFLGDPVPRDPELIDQFVSVDATGRKAVVGRDGADPAGLLRIAAPGLTIIGYQSHASQVVLPAEKFNQYLDEEGLDAVAALRARRRQTNASARERFSRCVKSLLLSGAPGPGQGDRALGFRLELIAERNPYALGSGQGLPVRLLYDGRPLPGALVVAMNRRHPAAKLTARTDRDGRVHLPLQQAGMWLVKAVHMVAAAPGQGAEWESFWASLTFELKA